MFKKKIHKQEIKEPSPLETMERASTPVLPIPFNGVIVMCKVRCLNSIQLKAVGEYHLINVSEHKESNPWTIEEMVEAKNWQEALVKETLISPTFEEIQERVYGNDNIITERKKRLQEIRDIINTLPVSERLDLEKEANTLELFIGSLLPDDFMAFITNWATMADRGDVKKLTREMLLESAILAVNGHDNPIDHLHGEFKELHLEEINRTAWQVYNEYQTDKSNEQAIFKDMKVIKGGRVGK